VEKWKSGKKLENKQIIHKENRVDIKQKSKKVINKINTVKFKKSYQLFRNRNSTNLSTLLKNNILM